MKTSFFTTRVVASLIIALVLILAGTGIYQNRNTQMSVNFAGNNAASGTASGDMPIASSSATSVTTGMPANVHSTTSVSVSTPHFELPYAYSSSRTAGWTIYKNDQYGFSIKYPANASVRDFIDGMKKSYGIALTIPQSAGFYSEKYFELTVESVGTTLCDAMPGFGNEKVTINGSAFGRTEYEDAAQNPSAPSHVVQYLLKKGSSCYKGYLRLNSPRFAPGALDTSAKASVVASESAVLEDMMHTFIINK